MRCYRVRVPPRRTGQSLSGTRDAQVSLLELFLLRTAKSGQVARPSTTQDKEDRA